MKIDGLRLWAKGKGKKSPKKGAKDSKTSGSGEIPEGLKRIPDIELFPNFLLKLEAEEETLLDRLSAITGESDPTNHNNEKDFQRRYQAYVQARKEDERDLASKVKGYAARVR